MSKQSKGRRGIGILAAVWGLCAGISPSQGQAPVPPVQPLPPAANAVPPAANPAPANPAPTIPTPPPGPTRFLPRVASHMETNPAGIPFAVLTINETEAATIRADAGGFSPEQRASIAAQRLTDLLQGGLKPDEITVEPDVKPAWRVVARGGTLLLATQADGDAHNQMSPKALALAWQKAVRLLLSEPPLMLSTKRLVVPLGESRTVTVGGAVLPTDVLAQDSSSHVGTTVYSPTAHTLTIRGDAVGSETVTVAPAPGVGGAPVMLPVQVMQYAGTVASPVRVEVTGNPAPPDLVTQAAYLGLTEALSLQSGAQMTVPNTTRFADALAAGGVATAPFTVRLSGDNLLPVDGRPVVTITNAVVPVETPSELLYSNAPEQVKRSQTLYTAGIRAGATVRLDFHHQNMSGELLTFHVDLINTTDTPTTVHLIAGISLPGANTVQVGRRAGAAFLANLNADDGLVLTVPGHGSVPLVTQRFASGLTLSGIMQIHDMQGSGLTLEVRASADTDILHSSLWQTYMAGDGDNALAAPSDTIDLVDPNPVSPDVFPRPQVALQSRYVVGDRWAFVPLGEKEALHSVSGDIRLHGNYGVDYEIALTLVNPTTSPRSVGVFFSPTAGLSAGVFQVDAGPILEYDPFQPPDERQLALVTLQPGETRVVHVRTIPLNGSSYPAQIIVRALDKTLAPPPPPVAASGAPPGATAVATQKVDR